MNPTLAVTVSEMFSIAFVGAMVAYLSLFLIAFGMWCAANNDMLRGLIFIGIGGLFTAAMVLHAPI